MKFQSSVYGTVTGIRFYKAAGNTGTHIGSLWTASGQLLTQVTFTNETASGWQSASFASPVTIMPNTTYVVGYLAPNGHYSGDSGWFYPAPSPPPTGGGDYNNPPLSAVPNNTSANGLFAYTSSSVFPTSTFQASNYWVDVNFMATPAPGQVTNVSATGGFNSANVSWTAPSTGGAPTSYIVTPYIGSTAQTPTTVTGTPPVTNATISNLTQGTAYTFTVQAVNPAGNGAVSAASNSVTPSGPQAPAAPTNVSANPASAQAQVSWTAPNNNGSAVTGYTVTPFIGSTAQTPVQVLSGSATTATVTGLNGRHGVHVHGQRHQQHRDRARVVAVQRGDAHGHDLRLRHAADDRLRRHRSGGARRQVDRGQQRHGHRPALLQGLDEHRHAISGACGPRPARCWHRPHSPTRPPPAGST